MGTVTLSRTTVIALLFGYVLLIASVCAPLIINMQNPTYVDVNVLPQSLLVHGIAWKPDITTKTFSSLEITIENTATDDKSVSISVIMWNINMTQIAEGNHANNIVAGDFQTFNVALSWNGNYTTDDIAGARIMVY